MDGREAGSEPAFRDGHRDWIADHARRDDVDRPGCSRSPFKPNLDGFNDWDNEGSVDRTSERRNPFPSKNTFDDRRGVDDFSDRGRLGDRNRDNRNSRERSPGRTNPFTNDTKRRRSRDRSTDRPGNDSNRWEGRDRFGRDVSRIIDRRSRSPVEKNVDNWGRELRLGTASRNDASRSPDRNSRSDRRRSVDRNRSRERNVSKDGSRRSRERDWKRSVDDFLGTRGSCGSSPSSRPQSRARDSSADKRERSGWNDKTEAEWDREIRRFELDRVRVPAAPIIRRDDRRSPKRGFSPRDRRRSRSRDYSPRTRSRDIRRSRSRDLPRRSRSRDLPRRSRSKDRTLQRSRSRDFSQRNESRRSREPRELSSNRHKPRDLTPTANENSDGEDMVISDDDNNEDAKQNIDDWEQMMLMKYSRNEEDGDRKIDFRARPPQKTVVIRCMPSSVTEVDIHLDITSSNFVCHDIRLVRRKDTGFSRGFAFVEFYNAEDARSWMELKQGVLQLGKAKCLMEYSVPREAPAPPTPVKFLNDWICNKCQAHNFSKRFLCFVCSATRTFGDVESSNVLASDHPTNTVVLLGLDVLTSEETVLKSIASLSNLPIRSVKVARDPFTNISKGGCYLEMNSVIDAFNLFTLLNTNVPEIDGRRPEVKYARIDFTRPTQAVSMIPKSATATGKAGNAAIAAAQWSNQQGGSVAEHTLADVPRLAEYSASLYATTPAEKIAYYTYYQGYYKEQISKGIAINLPADSAAGLATAQAALAASKDSVSPLAEPPDGSGTAMYPLPDTSVYQYDPSSGFYYDPFTTLYYDANSQYYYNTKLGKYLYWDAARKTYLPTPSSAETPEMSKANAGTDKNGAVIVGAPQPASKEEKKKEKEGDVDRVKVAKRIAKDMEKWAKTLNQKKETAKQVNAVVTNPPPAPSTVSSSQSRLSLSGAADIGFAVLERKDHLSTLGNYYESLATMRGEPSSSAAAVPSVESDEEDETNEDKNHTDWDRLICLLCKRQLGSREALVKHQQMSDLHKQNLTTWYRAHGLDPDDAQKRQKQYRDRASERRKKYGMPDAPKPSRLKENYIKSRETAYEQPTVKGIGTENKGNRLLQKMGWQQGMGLGKKNQGRTSIIEATSRSATAGLGTRSVGITPGPGETYKDCVKKMMAVRYAQLDDQC